MGEDWEKEKIMDRSTDEDGAAEIERVDRAEDDFSPVETKEDPLFGDRERAMEITPADEYPQVDVAHSIQHLSHVTCDLCGKVLGSGKNQIEAILSASMKGMSTIIKPVGFWFETRYFCSDCRKQQPEHGG